MNAIAKNALVVIFGLIVGSVVNMGLVNIGPSVVPLPEGADVTTLKGLRESMKLFTPADFIFPFLGHALGTLAGAFATAMLAGRHQMKLALVIGILFLAGGISMVFMAGGPAWFIATDLFVAYIPMSFIGGLIADRFKGDKTS